MNDKLDYDLYVLAEINYQDNNKLQTDKILFPEGWYSMNNYKLKTEILAQALENNLLIKDTPIYKEALLNGLFN